MKDIIFDFGKVLVEYEPEYITAQAVSDPEDAAALIPVVFDRLYWDALDEGTLTDGDFREAIFARLPERLHGAAWRVYLGWVENLPTIEGMPALVRTLKERGCRLYLLSNISRYFVSKYPEVARLDELLSLFDGKVFSAELGMVKPSADIFNYILDKYGLDPANTVFIDDNAANIAAAAALGIGTYNFDGDAAKLGKYLEERIDA